MFLILRIEYFESLESNAELTLRVFFGTLNVNSGLTEPFIKRAVRRSVAGQQHVPSVFRRYAANRTAQLPGPVSRCEGSAAGCRAWLCIWASVHADRHRTAVRMDEGSQRPERRRILMPYGNRHHAHSRQIRGKPVRGPVPQHAGDGLV